MALQALSRAKTVCGMDVCGEPYLHPQDLLPPTWQQKVEKNTRANVEIVQTVFQTQPEKNVS
ncbi:MAG TPA: hypothetical protein GX511_07175 [Firmicutes bacterium]|nr:hypothetical protein [Bacillota bacterium]